jgi:TDG/mug DNA glycosylase family protein
VPNPSGLNAHATIDSLARDYREVAEAAGVPLDDVPTLP